MNIGLSEQTSGIATAILGVFLAVTIVDAAKARARAAGREEAVQFRSPGTPVLAIVALSEQRITVYDPAGKILRAPVSTGRADYETPAGIYNVLQKRAEHDSNLYDDASMPFMQRITWSGIALHAGALPGNPASHGCIRLPHGFAERLFQLTNIGLRVLVVRRDVAPTPISHPALFQPKPIVSGLALTTHGGEGPAMRLGLGAPDAGVPPPTIPSRRLEALQRVAAAKAAEAATATERAERAKAEAARMAADAAQGTKAVRAAESEKSRADAQLSAAERALLSGNEPRTIERAEQAKAKALAKVAEAQSRLDTVKAEAAPKEDVAARARDGATAAEAAKVAAVEAAKSAKNKMAPVSVFISRQTQRLYVRQAFQPVFDTPVMIRDADKPIGTHIFTALAYTAEDIDLQWNAVSMFGSTGEAVPRRNDNRLADPRSIEPAEAKAALDRVDIPREAIERIAEVVSPGSSLIISDEGIHKETGKGTDFVILMSGEPQGGIKIRQRSEERSRYARGDDRRYDRRNDRSPFWGGAFFRW
jgi:L,D-transpeptidase catalytic domain